MATLAELSFGKRIQPEEVTADVRRDLAHEEWQREWTWIGLLAVLGVAVALGISLAYRWHGEPVGTEIPAALVVALLTGLSVVGVQAYYARRRKFVMKMPAARALVLSVEPTYKYSDDGSSHQKRLKLRYVPRLGIYGDQLELLLGAGTVEVVADLSPHALTFADGIVQGAMVSVIYDPSHPERLRVIERVVQHHSPPIAA